MKLYLRSIVAILLTVILFASGAGATSIIGSGGYPGFGYDDGAKYFNTANVMLSMKLFDIGPMLPANSAFGFYFLDRPDNIIGLFQTSNISIINFQTGQVIDELNNVIQTFTPSNAYIGFVYMLQLPNGGPLITAFSDPALNGGIDRVATFPQIGDSSTHLIGYEIFNPDIQDFVTMGYNLVQGPTSAVPEPATIVLLGIGMTGVMIAGINKRRKNSRT